MEVVKFERQLRLMEQLTQNRSLSISELAAGMGVTCRTVYRYLETFKQAGFVVQREGGTYRLDPGSPFFKRVSRDIRFSEAEARTIAQVLHSVRDNTPQVRRLRDKLAFLTDPTALAGHGVDERVAQYVDRLFQAMREERLCVFRDYSSPNGKDTRDRIVEPFQFLSGNSEVRCYEPASGTNKTFKVVRAADVELLDLLWANKAAHQPVHTDLFHFSGERRARVRLLLGQLAASLLLEEFPLAEQEMTCQKDGRWLLDTRVCSYKGIGRFVLGLFDDVEVVGSPVFRRYLRDCCNTLSAKWGASGDAIGE
ncbi:MAG: WYL domain-containing protein [Alloprevotella sp.]|nr:WYL domain-containing protein [Alloprevotella sp.]